MWPSRSTSEQISLGRRGTSFSASVRLLSVLQYSTPSMRQPAPRVRLHHRAASGCGHSKVHFHSSPPTSGACEPCLRDLYASRLCGRTPPAYVRTPKARSPRSCPFCGRDPTLWPMTAGRQQPDALQVRARRLTCQTVRQVAEEDNAHGPAFTSVCRAGTF